MIAAALKANGPAEAATSPSRVTPQPEMMEKMMQEHSTNPPAGASAAAPAPGATVDDAIAEVYRVRLLLDIMGDLLSGPFSAPDARRRYHQAATLVDFAKGKLWDTIRVLEGGEA